MEIRSPEWIRSMIGFMLCSRQQPSLWNGSSPRTRAALKHDRDVVHQGRRTLPSRDESANSADDLSSTFLRIERRVDTTLRLMLRGERSFL